MGEITKQINFQAPLDRVWSIWTDVEKTPQWVFGVQESAITSPGKEGKGLCWSEKCLFGKKVIQMDHEITEWKPKERIVIQTGLPMGGTMERTAVFQETREGVQVTIRLEWDLGIVGAFFDEGKLHHLMEKSFDETAAQWKVQAQRV